MLSGLKVFYRILLIAAVSAVAMAAIAFVGYRGMSGATAALDVVYKDRVVPLKDIKEIADLYAVYIVDASHKARNGNISFSAALSYIEKAQQRIDVLWNGYLNTTLTAREKEIVDDIQELRRESVPSIDKLKNILRNNDQAALVEYTVDELYPVIEPLSDEFSNLVALQIDVSKEEYDNAEIAAKQAVVTCIVVLLAAMFIGVSLAVIVARQITRELGGEPSEVAAIASCIADGNLTSKIAVARGLEKSILGSMQKMQNALREIVTLIKNNAEKLAQDSNSMAASGDKVMQGAHAQSESTSSIAAAVEQMSASVTQIAENAEVAHKASQSSSQTVDRSAGIVDRTIAEMNSIAEIVSETAEDVKTLSTQSADIGTVVGVIKDIADQTNLLALNAAIEAARAGEAGRGFAVVADEVRKLAERTAKSVSEIVSTINTIMQSTEQTLGRTEQSKEEAHKGASLATEMGGSMKEVKSTIDQTMDSVTNITEALAEQSKASQMIGQKLETIAQMTAENSDAVTLLSKTAGSIKTLAENLYTAVQKFKL
ncbi:methyl-accepting chemotaxis protein [Campylobacterota bacterium]|nr:methyl-accepting chemotaxis protein [Campylobacterota bacterium]